MPLNKTNKLSQLLIAGFWGAQAPSPAVFGALAEHILKFKKLPARAPAVTGEAPALPG